ncbi:MAG: 3-keto-disaccharide hydrolase [Verrucomicrobiales bacterium]
MRLSNFISLPLLLATALCGFGGDFVPLFDGKSSDGWAGAVENYSFENGMIQCKKGKGGTIYTKKEYTDFIVCFEFKLPAGGNNGLAIRYPGEGDPAYSGMCELQVLDNTAPEYAKLDPRQFHGSAYGMVAAKRGHLKPVGEWNKQTVTVKGSTIKVVLNGVEILNADLSTVTEFKSDSPHPGKDLKKGHFGFAGHGSPVAFRNATIKEISDAN